MIFSDFHFIRPYWLLAILGLFVAMWLLKRLRVSQSGWTKLIPTHLSKTLLEQGISGKAFSTFWPFTIGLIAIIALAGPTWQKLPQPVYQMKRGSVMIMDMSYSMYSTDIAPNRLTRARYKAIDLLDNLNEGDIGLIAYAGDAFTISPLTEDINNIKLLLPSLSPDLMPELGSNPLAALHLANDMLANAGHVVGDIYWFTDGIDFEDVRDINDWSKSFPHRLNILGIGTQDGAPIKLTNGELMKDDNGAIVLPRLSVEYLSGLVNQSSGVYQTISHKNNDIKALISNVDAQQEKEQGQNSNTGDQWMEAGPYLVVLILPLLLGYFRRGVMSVALVFFYLTPPNDVYAIEWKDLWKTQDQQGQQAFNQEKFEQAASTFERPDWQGSAHFKAGNYEEALSAFEQGQGASSFYNQGNALAKLNRLEDAIQAYDEALKLDPSLEDAAKNKAIIEKLKQEQESQQQQDQEGDQQQDGEQSESEQESQEQQNSDQKEGEQSQDQQQSDGQENEQQSQNSDNQQNEHSEAENNEKQSENTQESEEAKESEQQESLQAQESDPEANENSEEKQAQLARQEQIDQEKAQKHQQLLNKVTDDPYLLLRNKMQLEYQKRRQNGSQSGVKKKW